MRVDGLAAYSEMARLELELADGQATAAAGRAEDASKGRELEHKKQAEANAEAQKAAEEGGFWGDLCDIAGLIGAGAAIAASGGGGALAVAVAGAAMQSAAVVGTRTGLIERGSAGAIGLQIGGALGSGVGVGLGAHKGFVTATQVAGAWMGGAATVTGGVGLAGSSVVAWHVADARAAALDHEAARLELGGRCREAVGDLESAIEHQGEVSQRINRFQEERHEAALQIVRA